MDDNGNLIDPEKNEVIQENIMSRNLFEDLMRQMSRDMGLTLRTDYQMLNR